MNYGEALDYLYNKTLVFQHIGAQAYKPGLETTIQLSEMFGHPERSFKSIHVAGTNGKGSTSHLLAAILQDAGYKVGLYTSPHLLDFRERIRVNGEQIGERFVCDFIDDFTKSGFAGRQPSFFELTTIMAFAYFKAQGVDYAVVEVGLGGRLDSTNIISPIVSVITNISFDHTQFLGHTLADITKEKAGIIKEGTPVVIGEYTSETRPVFTEKAEAEHSPIRFAQDADEIISAGWQDGKLSLATKSFGVIQNELTGECQVKNANTVLNTLKELGSNVRVTTDNVRNGFARVCESTGLAGRWMKVAQSPATVCDTGHNSGGFQYIAHQLSQTRCRTLRIVLGFVSDKDFDSILGILPKNAAYYFTRPSVARALPVATLTSRGASLGLRGQSFQTVKDAYEAAVSDSATDDFIYVGGSTFVVADLLTFIKESRQS